MNPNSQTTHYDFAIVGGGCAGLSLAYRMAKEPALRDKKIVLIEKSQKTDNDRTWCFWEKENEGLFDEIVVKKWQKLWFHYQKNTLLELNNYRYKMIRGTDFYAFVHQFLRQCDNITLLKAEVKHIKPNPKNKTATIETNDQSISAECVFNSIHHFLEPTFNTQFAEETTQKSQNFYLMQHFKGWIVETQTDVFDEHQATLMDFRVEQTNQEIRFVYVLPTSKRRALIEYTVFSDNLLSQTQYDNAIENYLADYLPTINDYQIIHQEFGIIPMTNQKFDDCTAPNMINIGTNGGAAKPSTGYTFQRIQRQTEQIVNQLKNGKDPKKLKPNLKQIMFEQMDTILLKIFVEKRQLGAKIFEDLYTKNNIDTLLQFLDEDTTIAQNIAIMNTVELPLFIKATLNLWAKKLTN